MVFTALLPAWVVCFGGCLPGSWGAAAGSLRWPPGWLGGGCLSIPDLGVELSRPGARSRRSVKRPRSGLVTFLGRAFRGTLGFPYHPTGEGSGGPRGRRRRWDLWIVDRWLPFHRRFQGARLVRVPSSGVPRRPASTWSSMLQPRTAPLGAGRVPVADLALGNSVGATGMVPGALPVRRWCPAVGRVS